MKKRILSLFLVLAMTLSVLVVVPFTVSAETNTWSDSNYVISTLDDMLAFEAAVDGGKNFANETVTLAADITLPANWDGIGATSSKPFSGSFNGQGHTITINQTLSNSDGQGGVFNFVRVPDGGVSVIENLIVVGTINASTSGGSWCVGTVVSCVDGGTNGSKTSTFTMRNVKSSVNLNATGSSGSFNGYGGLVGFLRHSGTLNALNVNIDSCVYDGTMNFGRMVDAAAAILGTAGKNITSRGKITINITNTVFAGEIKCAMYSTKVAVFVSLDSYGNNYNSSGSEVEANITDCVSAGKVTFISADFSNYIFGIASPSVRDEKLTMNVKNLYYVPFEIPTASGSRTVQLVESGVTGSNLTCDANSGAKTNVEIAALTASDFTADCKLSFKENDVAGNRYYYPCPTTLVSENGWLDSLTYEVSTFSASNPVIQNLADLKVFEAEVDAGASYSGTTVVLENDLTLPADWDGIGTYDNAFSGIFDGKGHTITASGNGVGEDYGSFFAAIDGATVKNVHFDGTVIMNGNYSAVLASNARGTCLIKNVRISTRMNANNVNISSSGGFISYGSYGKALDLTFDGCVFDGTMNFTNQAQDNGGFFGRTGKPNGVEKKVTVKDSVYAGTMMFNDKQCSRYNGCFFGFIEDTSTAFVKDCVSIGKMTFITDTIDTAGNAVVMGESNYSAGKRPLTIDTFYYVPFANATATGEVGIIWRGSEAADFGSATNVKAMSKTEIASLNASAFSADSKLVCHELAFNNYYPCPEGLLPAEGWLDSLTDENAGDAKVLGAQIRYIDDADQYSGMRFVTMFKADAEGLANAGSADATFGVILISKANYEALETKTFATLSQAGVKVNAIKATTEDGYVTVKTVIYNIAAENYDDEIIAVPYIGEAIAGDNVARSIYTVAQGCVNSNTESAAAKTFAQAVIDSVEG